MSAFIVGSDGDPVKRVRRDPCGSCAGFTTSGVNQLALDPPELTAYTGA